MVYVQVYTMAHVGGGREARRSCHWHTRNLSKKTWFPPVAFSTRARSYTPPYVSYPRKRRALGPSAGLSWGPLIKVISLWCSSSSAHMLKVQGTKARGAWVLGVAVLAPGPFNGVPVLGFIPKILTKTLLQLSGCMYVYIFTSSSGRRPPPSPNNRHALPAFNIRVLF